MQPKVKKKSNQCSGHKKTSKQKQVIHSGPTKLDNFNMVSNAQKVKSTCFSKNNKAFMLGKKNPT